MSDLAEFLLARIAEDEATARTASIGSSSWRLDDLNETVCWWPPEPESVIEFERAHGLPLSDGWRGQTIEAAGDKIAPHIARWDPARVLAECEAKRQTVESCLLFIDDKYGDAPTLAQFVLHSLSLPYADHPDYREEWRVG